MPPPVTLEMLDDIAVITIDNPPVNALSQPVRAGLLAACEQAGQRGSQALVLHCAGRTFIAGADIRELGRPIQEPLLPDVLDRIEACAVPVIAAIHGTALGGGLETALAAHFRIAAPDARLGFPEVNLGLLPGAGGTQRSPRLIGIQAALELMMGGKPIDAPRALQLGLVDRLAEGDLAAAAVAYARELIDTGHAPRRTADLPLDASSVPHDFFAEYRATVARKSRGLPAPQRIIDCVEQATRERFSDGCAFEREQFMHLLHSPESAGLRHVFFAEREAGRVAGLPADCPLRPVGSVGIIGAGTMGGGIAMSFANAGIPVTLLEVSQEALDRGLAVCRNNYQRSVAAGRFSARQAEQCLGRISGATDYPALADADLLIEAVFENPDIKKTVFRKLDEVCKPGAILASNTSYQDINAIAAVTSRPQDVLGMHFFSPANVMKLLEVVRAEKTADDVLATVMKLARTIRKVPVLAGVCYGFIGNRMLQGYFREAQMLLLEGATAAQVDQAMESFGMAMGPLAVADLAGLDIGYKARRAIADLPDHPSVHVADQLVEMGRNGQKSGAGFYRYDPATRKRQDDPEVAELVRAEAARLGIRPRSFSAEEIVERAIYPLINEGARILAEGIAQRPGDIDIVYVYGYGFPAHRGGPMFYADTVGLDKIHRSICDFRDRLKRPGDWQPAPTLEQLARLGGKFGS